MAATDDRSRPPPSRAPAAMEPIKVRELRAKGPDTQLPPPARGGILRACTKGTGETITIQYEPWQRHHRVREIEGGVVKHHVCIPESWVAYTPEE
jgi:hypothetical protein